MNLGIPAECGKPLYGMANVDVTLSSDGGIMLQVDR
jgi:hypothetical protein